MKRQVLSILLAFLPFFIFAQAYKSGKVSPYTASFLTSVHENASDSTGTTKLLTCYMMKSINNQRFVNVFIELNENANLEVLKSYGALININLPGIVSAQIPVESLETIAMLPEVKHLEIAIPVRAKMDKARVATNVDKVQSGTALPAPFKGKNVVIGIIDSGIEFGHINFYDSLGTTYRIKKVWDQNVAGTHPTGYTYGTEYKTQSAILAAQFDNKTETHATHVTGIAAGADKSNGNIYYGVAPEADIVFVSYNLNDQSSDNVSIADGIKYIYDYATSVNEPCVVNMSLGTQMGPHDGTSAFDQVCDALEGKGRLLVGAAGNEGMDSLHLSQTFTSTNTTLKSFFNYYVNTKLDGATDIWGDAGKNFTIRVVVYNKTTGNEVYTTPTLTAATTNSQSYTLTSANGAVGSIQIFTERNATNTKPNAFVYTSMTSITSGNYIGVIITAQDGTIHAWADDVNAYFSGKNITGWTSGNSNNSVSEVGGTGKKIITVGAYTTKNTFTNTSNATYHSSEVVNQIADFSSKGPTLDGRTKPDITAPGSLLISSYSSAIITSTSYKNYIVKMTTVNGKSYYYGQLSGTSMATPMVTGILATWLGVKNDLSPDDVRAILQSTSITDSYTGTIPSGGSNIWGYGKIDAWSGIKSLLKTTQLQLIQENSDNVLIYPNPTNGVLSFLFAHNDANVKLLVFTMSGQLVFQQQVGDVKLAQEVVVNLPNLISGVYLVTVKGNLPYKSHQLLFR